jgi:hypothetical protein
VKRIRRSINEKSNIFAAAFVHAVFHFLQCNGKYEDTRSNDNGGNHYKGGYNDGCANDGSTVNDYECRNNNGSESLCQAFGAYILGPIHGQIRRSALG